MERGKTYSETLLGTLAAGIRQERLIAAALAERIYKDTGYMPKPITKETLIDHANKSGEKIIGEDLETGEITEAEAKEARQRLSQWLAELQKAPDEIEKRQIEAIKRSLEREGLEMPEEVAKWN